MSSILHRAFRESSTHLSERAQALFECRRGGWEEDGRVLDGGDGGGDEIEERAAALLKSSIYRFLSSLLVARK